jgi:Family of unknown function (DUF6157)
MNNPNYFSTFIEVADDCPVTTATIPAPKGGTKTMPLRQYEMIARHPLQAHAGRRVVSNVRGPDRHPDGGQVGGTQTIFRQGSTMSAFVGAWQAIWLGLPLRRGRPGGAVCDGVPRVQDVCWRSEAHAREGDAFKTGVRLQASSVRYM